MRRPPSIRGQIEGITKWDVLTQNDVISAVRIGRLTSAPQPLLTRYSVLQHNPFPMSSAHLSRTVFLASMAASAFASILAVVFITILHHFHALLPHAL